MPLTLAPVYVLPFVGISAAQLTVAPPSMPVLPPLPAVVPPVPLVLAGVLANISARAPEPSRRTLWQTLRTVRARSKNRRNGIDDVEVVVEVR